MKNKSPKHLIYKQIFLGLFSVYFVLMIGLSIFLIEQQNKIEAMKFGSMAGYINQKIGLTLQTNIDDQHQITDLSKLKQEFLSESALFSRTGVQLAVYSRDYSLLLNTKNDWVCSFSVSSDGNTFDTHYAYLNPRDWFSEKEVNELEYYLNAEPKAKVVGDLTFYSVSLNGFFFDGQMIHPTEIIVCPSYASEFDANGELSTAVGHPDQDGIVYHAKNNENPKGLTYYPHGAIYSFDPKVKEQKDLCDIVLDQDKLRRNTTSFTEKPYVKVNPVTYRYYAALPYQNRIDSDTMNQPYSEFWTVCATDVNLLKQCSSTLMILWAGSFIPFFLSGWILSAQTYKVYLSKNGEPNNDSELG